MPSGSAIVLRNSAEADIPTPDTDQIAIFNDADDSNTPAYKDEAGIVTSLRGVDGTDGELTYQDHGNTGSTETVDASAANVHRLVLNAATVTLTLSGAPAIGTPGIVRLRLVQDGTGGRLMSWPGSVSWVTGSAPTLSTGAGAIDIIDLETEDGGTTWYGIMVGQRGATGTTGATGGAISIPYTFSTTTTDSDPGSGNLRLSNATQNAATVIRVDLLDSAGATVTGLLDSFADTDNAILGDIRLFKTSDPTKWIVFEVASVASPSGYRNITVIETGSSASSPFSNSDAITLAFTRSGDQGSTVGSGTVTTVEEVDASPTDSAVTKIVFPNGTLGIASHVATYTPAVPVTTFLTGAVTQTTAGTWYSGPSTGAITIDGTYEISGQLYVDCSSLGSANEESVRLYDGSAGIANAAMVFDNTTNRRASIVVSPVTVVVSGSTTFTLQATNTSNGATIKATLDNNGVTNKASWITIRRTA